MEPRCNLRKINRIETNHKIGTWDNKNTQNGDSAIKEKPKIETQNN